MMKIAIGWVAHLMYMTLLFSLNLLGHTSPNTIECVKRLNEVNLTNYYSELELAALQYYRASVTGAEIKKMPIETKINEVTQRYEENGFVQVGFDGLELTTTSTNQLFDDLLKIQNVEKTSIGQSQQNDEPEYSFAYSSSDSGQIGLNKNRNFTGDHNYNGYLNFLEQLALSKPSIHYMDSIIREAIAKAKIIAPKKSLRRLILRWQSELKTSKYHIGQIHRDGRSGSEKKTMGMTITLLGQGTEIFQIEDTKLGIYLAEPSALAVFDGSVEHSGSNFNGRRLVLVMFFDEP